MLGTIALGGTVLAAPSSGVEQRIDCPAEIPQQSLSPPKSPQGWTSSTRGGLMLHAVDLSYGPPSDMAFLKPEVVAGRGKKFHYKWTELQADGAAGSIWVACSYGRSDNVILGRRLDDKTSECTAADTQDKQGRYVIEVSCKLRR
jgi:hypothetical protein